MKEQFAGIRWAIVRYFKSIDQWLLALALFLSIVSVVFLHGIVENGYAGTTQVYTQIAAILIGLFAAFLCSLLDYHTLAKLWKVALPLCLILVFLTFVVGVERGSNRAWLGVHLLGFSFTVQPAEFLKLVFILTFGQHIQAVRDDINRFSNVLLLALHGGAYILLIMLQRDAGTAIVFLGMFLVMIFLSGLDWKYILVGLSILGLLTPLIWRFIMSDDQKLRFLVLHDPTINADYAYQQLQGLKALGMGGLTGTGFAADTVFVPESYNDFIFTYIGQVTGLVGLVVLLSAFFFLITRVSHNAGRSADSLGHTICNGVMAMLLIQCIMNIGMCINVLPVIGVTLPLVSAGGTSVVSVYLGLGFVQSVYRHKGNEFMELYY